MDVHTEHCCLEHGCKYGDDNCTVVTGKEPQSFPCETCRWVEEERPEIKENERLHAEVRRLRELCGRTAHGGWLPESRLLEELKAAAKGE